MDTRERLIHSTQALLWERGYIGTSPKAIQQHAGAGQGSMYHHFPNKAALALAAIERCAGQIKSQAEHHLSMPGVSAYQRIEAYLLSDKNVLKGCQLGRLTQDPGIEADPALHQPVHETFAWLQQRLFEVIQEGQDKGEFPQHLAAQDLAATLAGVLQGGYVLAKASGTDTPYFQAARGILAMLAPTT